MKEICGFCEYKENITLADDGMAEIYNVNEEDNSIYIVASYGSEEMTDFYYPKYCPECGKRINLTKRGNN